MGIICVSMSGRTVGLKGFLYREIVEETESTLQVEEGCMLRNRTELELEVILNYIKS
jgi:hypothetical protein